MFSYDDYTKIIEIIKSTGNASGYKEALNKDAFVIMRHDVEYSVERAYELSQVEDALDFYSTYFFQWTNNSYNILSRKNQKLIRDMHDKGHTIGLHFALNGLTDMQKIRERISKEILMLNGIFEFEIEQFSIHRPSNEVLRANIKMPGIINAYQDDFFTFGENVTEDTPVDVKYLSDANHIWRYGYPDEKNIKGHNKVQILTHPFAWTKEGYDNFNNYKTLINEKYIELIESVNNECKDFIEYKEWFLDKAKS